MNPNLYPHIKSPASAYRVCILLYRVIFPRETGLSGSSRDKNVRNSFSCPTHKTFSFMTRTPENGWLATSTRLVTSVDPSLRTMICLFSQSPAYKTPWDYSCTINSIEVKLSGIGTLETSLIPLASSIILITSLPALWISFSSFTSHSKSLMRSLSFFVSASLSASLSLTSLTYCSMIFLSSYLSFYAFSASPYS